MHKGLWGRKTEGQVSFGVDAGSLRGGPEVTMVGQKEVREGHRRPPAAEFFFSFPEV